jgi:hypothetical protein
MTPAQAAIFAEIINERKIQDLRWGGPAHDDTLNRFDWVHICDKYRYRLIGGNARENFLKIASVCVAAIESIDRGADNDNRPTPAPTPDF